MDEKSKNILVALDTDARAPAVKISKKLGISKQLAIYKIKRLEETGVITKYRTIIDITKFYDNLWTVFIKFHRLSPELEQQVVDHLLKKTKSFIVYKMVGEYDFMFTAVGDSVAEFDQALMDFKSEFFESIISLQIGTMVKGMRFPLTYLTDKAVPGQEYSNERVKLPITQKDIDLISFIRNNARASLTEIGSHLGVTYQQAGNRLKDLVQKKVIRGFRANIDFTKIGLTHYLVFFRAKQFSNKGESMLMSWCEKNKHVFRYMKLLGEYSFSLEICVQDFMELQEFLKDIHDTFSDYISRSDICISKQGYEGDMIRLLQASKQVIRKD